MESPTKRPRVEEAGTPKPKITTVDLESMTFPIVTSVPLLSLRGTKPLQLRIFVQDRIAIINDGSSEVAWAAGALVVAFGRGKFNAKEVEDEVDGKT